MEPINVDINRRLRFGELEVENAASLFIAETVELNDQVPTLRELFETTWDSLIQHVDPIISQRDIGVLRTHKNTVWVESEGVQSPYSLSFVLCYSANNNRVIKSVWEYLPPAYPKPSETKKDFRITDFFNEKMIDTVYAEELFSTTLSSANAYLNTANPEQPRPIYSY
jgi:hypothetical protein